MWKPSQVISATPGPPPIPAAPPAAEAPPVPPAGAAPPVPPAGAAPPVPPPGPPAPPPPPPTVPPEPFAAPPEPLVPGAPPPPSAGSRADCEQANARQDARTRRTGAGLIRMKEECPLPPGNAQESGASRETGRRLDISGYLADMQF